MEVRAVDDPALSRFRDAVAEVYGDRVERIVLFGSRARGDARPDSDYDVAVFLHDLKGWLDEAYRLADIATDILYDSGEVISALPFKAGSYQDRTPLMHGIRADGIDI